jgi:hypothetical protein
MNFTITSAAIVGLMSMFSNQLDAQQAFGSSRLTISGGNVVPYVQTTLDSLASYYYTVGASGRLFSDAVETDFGFLNSINYGNGLGTYNQYNSVATLSTNPSFNTNVKYTLTGSHYLYMKDYVITGTQVGFLDAYEFNGANAFLPQGLKTQTFKGAVSQPNTANYITSYSINVGSTGDTILPSSYPLPNQPTTCGVIQAGEGLRLGTSINNCAGTFSLILQTDGNFVEYNNNGAAYWYTNTQGKNSSALYMQSDGNVVLYDTNRVPLWSSGTQGNPGASLYFHDNGALDIQSSNGTVIKSLCAPMMAPAAPAQCGTIAAGQGLVINAFQTSCDGRFQLILQPDGNLVLYQNGTAYWQSATVGGKIAYSFVMQGDGNAVLYGPSTTNPNPNPVWSTGTAGNPGATLVVQTDGNMVVYSSGGRALWNSHTAGR